MPQLFARRRRTKHPSAYHYHGKGAAKFRIPRPLLWGLVALGAVALILWGVATHLQQYMVYSMDGGRLVLPGQAEQAPDIDTSPLTDLVVVEEN